MVSGFQNPISEDSRPTADLKALQERQQYLARVLQNIHDAVIATDGEMRITLWNRAAEDLYGWEAAEVLGKKLSDVIQSNFSLTLEEAARFALADSSGSYRLETIQTTRSGRELIVESRNIALRDAAGRVIGYVSANRDVTLRKRAEEALRHSEEEARLQARIARLNLSQLEAVIHSMSEGVIIADALGRIHSFNAAALRMHGFSDPSEMPPTIRELTRLFRFATPDGVPLLTTEWPIIRAIQGYETPQVELIVSRVDGGATWTGLFSTGLVHDPHGQVTLLVTTIVDVTHQRRKERHALFLAQLSATLMRLNQPEAMVAEVSSRIGQYLQADRCFLEEVLPDESSLHVHEDYHGDLPSLAREAELAAFPLSLAERMRAFGQVVVADVRADEDTRDHADFFDRLQIGAFATLPFFRREKWIASLTVAYQQPHTWQAEDVELLRSAADMAWLSIQNARLYQSLTSVQERFRVAMQNTRMLIYTTDRDLRYTWIYNPQHGYSPSEVIGKTDAELIEPESAGRLVAIKKEVLETGVGVHREVSIRPGGETAYYEITVEPLRDEAQAITGLIVAAYDITERRQLAAEMRQSEQRLETQRLILQDREQERLKIAQDLHDGPLQGMMALSMEMSEMLRLEDQAHILMHLPGVREKLQGLAREIRNFCAEMRPPALAPFGLEKAIRSHVLNLESIHPGLGFTLELMEDGQALSEEMRLALFRIYQELIANIIRHASARRVDIRLTLDEAQVELEVQDDGAGFDPPAEWLEMAREGHFGLVGVAERAAMLDGRVLVRSLPGEGTLVRVIIPRAPELPGRGQPALEHQSGEERHG